MSARELWRRLRAAFASRRMHEELDEEMRLHLELRAEANRAAGLDGDEARTAARRRFGNPGVLAEQGRDIWGWGWLDALRQDLRYAARQLVRAPGFALVAVITVGIGLGLSTAAFTVYDTFALRPLPVRAPGEMVRVVRRGDRTTIDELPWSTVDLVRRNARLLRQVVVTSGPELLPAGTAIGTEPVSARFVSPDYFDMLGVRPSLGTLSDPPIGGVVLSYEFWSRRMGGDRGVIGRTLTVQGRPQTIVGVAPQSFAGTGLPPAAPDVWAPVAAEPLLMGGADWTRNDTPQWQLLARRAEGATIDQISAEVKNLATTLPADSGRPIELLAKQATFFQTDSGEFETFGEVSRVLMVAVGLILLIAALNLVNLLAARNASREREVTMRLALGAARSRIARQFCTESALLGLLGGACGLLLSIWLCRLFQIWIMGTLTQFTGGASRLTLSFAPDWLVFSYAGTLSLLVGVAVGLWPALRAAKGDVNAVLKPGATESRGTGARRHLLVTVQVASCLVLLSGAGLLLGGVWKSRGVTTGFDDEHLLMLELDPSRSATREAQAALTREAARRISAVPGVAAVAWSDRAPYLGHTLRTLQDRRTGSAVTFGASFVSDRFFDATGIAIVEGRGFTTDEVEQRRPVLVVSQALARRLWPGQDVVGRTVRPDGWLMSPDSVPYTIVGIARDVRNVYLSRVDQGYEYFPAPSARGRVLLIRTAAAPGDDIRPVLGVLGELGPDVPARAHLVTLRDGPLALQHMFSSAPAALAGALACLSLLLSAVSLYGLVAHNVARRTREIGIRVALGARSLGILGSMVRATLTPLAWGAALGALGAAGVSVQLTRMLSAPDAPDLTYGAGTRNPLVFAAVLGVLAVVAAVATVVPAARALKVDAMVALRQD